MLPNEKRNQLLEMRFLNLRYYVRHRNTLQIVHHISYSFDKKDRIRLGQMK